MIFNFADLDIKKEKNLYIALYKSIKEAVKCGAVKQGERLPSIREAAALLKISRTTVENAYARLCIEGIAESRPQRGYFIIGSKNIKETAEDIKEKPKIPIKYDFSSRRIDTSAADTETWKRLLRSVLRDSDVLTSYGDPQGEKELRETLAAYTYKARGVVTDAENIVIGAGIGPLLNIFCSLIGKDITVGIENGTFKEAESIFSNYGIKTIALKSDSNGALIEDIRKKNIDILFLLPSSLSKISVTGLAGRRKQYLDWVNEKKGRFIIEDDYNGELRYNARTVPAFRSIEKENCIYIGSFSKLLLPSVRIAYMVLPQKLTEVFGPKLRFYNQTSGKTEQLALNEYIKSGALEKHLRKLRRLYYLKSQSLVKSLHKHPDIFKNIIIFETSLTALVSTDKKTESTEICRICESFGLKVMPYEKKGVIKLCFAGISESEIAPAVELLSEVMKKIV